MALQSAQLLRQLEPAVRPNSAPATSRSPQTSIESLNFQQLLSSASKGDIHSGRQVDVSFDANPPLESSQLERLASAADKAEAAGAKRALMLIDGRGFVLDVHNRTLTAELGSAADAQAQNIDTAMFVSHDELQATALKLSAGVMPPAVWKQILTAQH